MDLFLKALNKKLDSILNLIFFLTVDTSAKLSRMLHNQYLKVILEEIDSSSSPQKLLNKALELPVFREFIDECLLVVEYDGNG